MTTKKIRIPLVIDPTGRWNAGGQWTQESKHDPFSWLLDDLEDGEARYWVEVEVPIPEPTVLAGTAELAP